MKNKDKYTSLELSKLFKENGCEIESENWYVKDDAKGDIFLVEKNTIIDLLNPKLGFEKVCNSYDIMWDIAIVHAKEFFGNDWCQDEVQRRCAEELIDDVPLGQKAYLFHPEKVFNLLQQGKKAEAEDYLWQNTLFNPDNKTKEE